MPPKRNFDDDSSSSETDNDESASSSPLSTASSSSASVSKKRVTHQPPPLFSSEPLPPLTPTPISVLTGETLSNNLHDEVFPVSDDVQIRDVKTPESLTEEEIRSRREGDLLANNPNDEIFEAGGDVEEIATPPRSQLKKEGDRFSGDGFTGLDTKASASMGKTGAPDNSHLLSNNPNDEIFEVAEATEVITPKKSQENSIIIPGETEGRMIKNASHDEFSDIETNNEEEVPTPQDRPLSPDGSKVRSSSRSRNQKEQKMNVLRNLPHDEVESVEGSSVPSTRVSSKGTGSVSPLKIKAHGRIQQNSLSTKQSPSRSARKSERSSSASSSTGDEDEGPKMGDIAAATANGRKGAADYNPADYASVNAKLPSEVTTLFSLISEYQFQQVEIPTKFRPFIPEYIPSVSDVDTFCKVSRPDGLPDNLGLTILDEPTSNQSNPAVVKIWLQYLCKVPLHSTFVQSVENAAERPTVIEKWVDDIKQLHYKKPLPTVSYTKPMPEIDELLQAWPQEFENLLASGAEFPPPQVDLDVEQYARMLCAILDIPIYGKNVIEALHVMFTLYVEFRSNQHFQHA